MQLGRYSGRVVFARGERAYVIDLATDRESSLAVPVEEYQSVRGPCFTHDGGVVLLVERVPRNLVWRFAADGSSLGEVTGVIEPEALGCRTADDALLVPSDSVPGRVDSDAYGVLAVLPDGRWVPFAPVGVGAPVSEAVRRRMRVSEDGQYLIVPLFPNDPGRFAAAYRVADGAQLPLDKTPLGKRASAFTRDMAFGGRWLYLGAEIYPTSPAGCVESGVYRYDLEALQSPPELVLGLGKMRNLSGIAVSEASALMVVSEHVEFRDGSPSVERLLLYDMASKELWYLTDGSEPDIWPR